MRVRGEGLQTTFIVRKDVSGVFVEKSFFLHSPLVVDVKFLKHTPVRRNYISYIRNSKKKITM
jgi:large subunit ribosomal protein L19